MIDHFTTTDFEKVLALSGLPFSLHHVDGEFVYDVVIDWQVAIRVRSSIWRDGHSAETGQDSIRFWMINASGNQISKLPGAYVTRVAGWQVRLHNAINQLWKYRLAAGDCPVCHQPLYIYRSTKKNANEGRLFCSCFNKACGKTFAWLADAGTDAIYDRTGQVYFTPRPTSAEVGTASDDPFTSISSPPENLDSQVAPTTEAVDTAGPREQEAFGPVETATGPGGDAVPISAEVGQASVLDSLEEEDVEEHSPLNQLDALEELEAAETELAEASALVAQPRRLPNADQAKAIYANIKGAYRVLAPPGSGKTFLLIRRIEFLLKQGVNMANILAVCFNGKMADELHDRFIQLMPEMESNTYTTSNICTIHAACYRILKAMGDKRRVPENDSWQIKKFVQERIKAIWPEYMRPTWKEVVSWIYTGKAHGLMESEFIGMFRNHFPEHAEGVERIRIGLQRFMDENGWLMFEDMLYTTEMKLLTDDKFRRLFQAMYKYILVDEGQDVSGQAMRILTKLAYPEDNFFIVGDTDQLMYRFTGATPEANLYEGFEQRFSEGRLIKLTTNYRSSHAIVKTCNQLIANNYEVNNGPYDSKYFKDVKTRQDAPDGLPVTFSMYDTPEEEASAVAMNIASALANGRKPKDFFVGARTRAQLTYLEPYMLAAKIPFINIAGSSFWDTRHIKDMLAFLQVAHNPYDEEAFARIYNIGSASNVATWGDSKGEYLSHHFLPRAFLQVVPNYHKCKSDLRGYRFPHKFSWKDGMLDIVDLVDGIAYRLQDEGIAAALSEVLEQCYRKYLVVEQGIDDDVDGGPLEDIATLISISRDFKTVPEMMEHIKAAEEQAKNVKDKNWDQYVVLSTIHRLKGLERPVVFGLGFCEGQKENPTTGESQPYGLLPHTYSMIPPPNLGILPGSSAGRIEDERCIAFVLVSRAKDECHLSGCVNYQGAQMHPSRFVYEMGLIEEIIA